MTHKNGLEKPHVIKVVDNPTPEIWGRCPGIEVLDRAELEFQGRVPGPAPRGGWRGPGRPIDWRMPSRVQAWRTLAAVYSLPWSVCMITPRTWPPRTAAAIASAP